MKKLLTRLALLMILCAALALPVFADAVTDSISVCIGYFGWSEDEYVQQAKFSWQELDDWNGSGRTYLAFARGFYIRDLLDYAGVDVNSIASIDFFTKDHSVGAYRSFTKYALLDQPRYYFPNLAGDAETGELYAWDGGDDLWVGAYQVEPMLALEDYTEWDTAGFDFESYADESLFSTGSRFHLFFGQASPEEAATSSAAKYVYKILVTFSGTPVLSSEESNLDLVVGSDHALHVTADAEDDALTAYVQEHLQYTSSDPAVVSVDQYGRLHVNAEGDAVITASFGESSVSVQVHVGSGGASGTGSAAGEDGPRRRGRDRPARSAAAGRDESRAGHGAGRRAERVCARGRRGLDRGKRHDRGRGDAGRQRPAPPAGQAGGKDRARLGRAGAERAARLRLRPDPV